MLRATMAVLVLLGLSAAPAGAQQPPTASQVTRGAYLVTSIAACGNCHTPKGPNGADLPGQHLAGGLEIAAPNLFTARVPNITQDRATGIGAWTDAQIALAIREGRRPDGSLIGPPMPFEVYRGISDADLAAMVAYLRTVPAVANRVTKSEFHIPLPPSYGPPVRGVAGPANTPEARGAYLAGPLGHCTECHTPMGANGQRDWTRTGAGGAPIGGPRGPVVPRNITPHPEAGIGGWSDGQIIRAITQGISADGRRLFPPMGYGYYARISPADLRDMVAWLRSLPPQP